MNFDEWVSVNPLKKWMAENQVTQVEVASFFGRSQFAIYTWIRGLIPDQRDDGEWFWDNLVELTGKPEIIEEWRDWMKLRPKPGAASSEDA